MTADIEPDLDVTPGRPADAAWPVYLLAALAVAWLAAMLWSANATITGLGGDAALAISRAALALPSVVTASLVAGVALGLAAIELAGRSRSADRVAVRVAVGAGAGVV